MRGGTFSFAQDGFALPCLGCSISASQWERKWLTECKYYAKSHLSCAFWPHKQTDLMVWMCDFFYMEIEVLWCVPYSILDEV